jgi:hypothetical protein
LVIVIVPSNDIGTIVLPPAGGDEVGSGEVDGDNIATLLDLQ